eukprot:TRINITY_DN10963_c0_g1_i2.p1 TRINITY_DN10963_c0_g1~~TRINITY_DN10963_c0_g1_i2.p1  ORF type:complete len:642 (-),score=60.98 TRINITY_DN10963_c0_g1_i2:1862-3760(-)
MARLRLPEPHWQEDDRVKRCPDCKSTFGFTLRRHHCRGCGMIVCDDCSQQKRQFVEIGLEKKERCCRHCLRCPLYLTHHQERQAYVRTEHGRRTGLCDDEEEERSELYLRWHLDQVESAETKARQEIIEGETTAAADHEVTVLLLEQMNEEQEERVFIQEEQADDWGELSETMKTELKPLKKKWKKERERAQTAMHIGVDDPYTEIQEQHPFAAASIARVPAHSTVGVTSTEDTQPTRQRTSTTTSSASKRSFRVRKSTRRVPKDSFSRPPTTQTVSHEGWLMKHGAGLSGWAKRWCVIKGPHLNYYNKQDGELKGTIDLNEAKITTKKGKEIFINGPFCKREFRLKIVEEKTLSRWVSSMKMAALGDISDDEDYSEYDEEYTDEEYLTGEDEDYYSTPPSTPRSRQSSQARNTSAPPSPSRSNAPPSSSSSDSSDEEDPPPKHRLSELPKRPQKLSEIHEENDKQQLQKDNIKLDDEAEAIANLMADFSPSSFSTNARSPKNSSLGDSSYLDSPSSSHRPSAASFADSRASAASTGSFNDSFRIRDRVDDTMFKGGYLEKKKKWKNGSKKWGGWQLRYFELKGNEMVYYEQKKGPKKGSFKVGGGTVITPDKSEKRCVVFFHCCFFCFFVY